MTGTPRLRMSGGPAFALLMTTLAAVPAAAQIDVSGRWHVVEFATDFGISFERSLTLAQSGTTLTVAAPSSYTGGTIDPITGVLHLDGSGGCFNLFTGEVTIIPWRIDAVASPDGASFDGTFEESIQPTLSCLSLTGTVHATRLPATCGDGVVDPGEACDRGLTGGACCTEFCTLLPAGTTCASQLDACTSSAQCDGADTCVHTPQPAGTLCRLAENACDTAEVCDGASTACPPPFTPTEPDVDDDGILDGCDDCVGQPLEAVRLRIGRFGIASTRDFVSLRARVRLPAGATLPDPPTTWKLVELRDATRAPLLYAQVSGGLWDPSLRQGWRRRGNRWSFRIDEPILGGVSRVRLAPRPSEPGVWDVRVTTRNASLIDAVPVLPLDLTLILDGLGPSTRCGQRRLTPSGGAAPSCTGPSPAGVIECR